MSPIDVYCDMTTDNGGWTLVKSIKSISSTQYDSSNIYENKQSFGHWEDDNYLSAAFYSLNFQESYLIDDNQETPVFSTSTFTAGTFAAAVDNLAITPGQTLIWSMGARTHIRLRNDGTNDGQFNTGDMFIQLQINSIDTTNLSHTVTSTYEKESGTESLLVLDSDLGFAAGRIAYESVTNISEVGVDLKVSLFVR